MSFVPLNAEQHTRVLLTAIMHRRFMNRRALVSTVWPVHVAYLILRLMFIAPSRRIVVFLRSLRLSLCLSYAHGCLRVPLSPSRVSLGVCNCIRDSQRLYLRLCFSGCELVWLVGLTETEPISRYLQNGNRYSAYRRPN